MRSTLHFFINVIRLDFTSPVPSRGKEKGNVDTAQCVVDRGHQQGVTRKEESGQSQSRVLR